MKYQIVIYGAGDLAREIFCTANTIYSTKHGSVKAPIAFVTDLEDQVGKSISGHEVFHLNNVGEYIDRDTRFIIGVGDPKLRRSLRENLRIKLDNPPLATLIHSSAVVFSNVEIQAGVYIGANTTIGVDSFIGENSIINQNVSFGHDCRIGAHVVISPGCILSGRTTIGSEVFLGSGAVTYPGIDVGDHCIVSALTPVTQRVKDKTTVMTKPNTVFLPQA